MELPINKRLILSIFDFTGAWPEPYIKAGYPVILWDKKHEGEIVSDIFFRTVEQYADNIYGILSATPCTFFAVSGARWWPQINESSLSEMVGLAQLVLILKTLCPNLKFWVQENPVGRLEKLIPEFKQYRRLSFNPCDFGDPYTKRTILWGEFNSDLKKNPVLPIYGSMMHTSKRSQSERSKTPSGFARAFFEANR